jgi:hypothetical protein
MDKFTNNLQKIKSLHNVDIQIFVTVTLLNVWFLDDIIAYGKTHGVDVKFSALYTPDFLSISSLPNDFKRQIPRGISKQIDELLDQDSSHLFIHTIAYILTQDKIKNTNIFDKMPFKDYAIQRVIK